MATILQMTFPIWVSFMKIVVLSLKVNLILCLGIQLTPSQIMAWHQTGDKPLYKPMMALFIDSLVYWYIFVSICHNELHSLYKYSQIIFFFIFQVKNYLLKKFETFHIIILYLSNFYFPCWTKFLCFVTKFLNLLQGFCMSLWFYLPCRTKCTVCFVVANLLCIASVPRVPQIGFVG